MKITKISFLLMGYPAAALVAYEYESGIESEDVQGYRITNPPIERATGGGENMSYTKYLLAYSLGYIATNLLLFLMFDWYSFGFLISSLLGLVLLAVVLKVFLNK